METLWLSPGSWVPRLPWDLGRDHWDDMTYGITQQDIAYLAIVVAMSKVNSTVVYVMGFLLALDSWHHKTFGQLTTSRQLVSFEADCLDHVRAQLFTDGDVP